jgi:hypothetical protein
MQAYPGLKAKSWRISVFGFVWDNVVSEIFWQLRHWLHATPPLVGTAVPSSPRHFREQPSCYYVENTLATFGVCYLYFTQTAYYAATVVRLSSALTTMMWFSIFRPTVTKLVSRRHVPITDGSIALTTTIVVARPDLLLWRRFRRSFHRFIIVRHVPRCHPSVIWQNVWRRGNPTASLFTWGRAGGRSSSAPWRMSTFP